MFQPQSCSASSSSLDCNHTHYILVEPPEDDKSDIWGRELALRNELLEFISYGHCESREPVTSYLILCTFVIALITHIITHICLLVMAPQMPVPVLPSGKHLAATMT